MNLIFKNEMKLMARSNRLVIMIAIYNTILAVIAFRALNYIRGEVLSGVGAAYEYMMPFNAGLMIVTAVMLAFIICPSAGGSISGERERQTLDILLSTRLSKWEILTGKILSSLSCALLMLISSTPILCISLMYGGLELGDIYASVLYIAFFSLLCAVIGVFCSCSFTRSVSAIIASFAFLMILTAGTGLIVILTALAKDSSSVVSLFNVGPVVWLWLVNPAVSFAGIISGQLGYSVFKDTLTEFGVPLFAVQNWTYISILSQLVLMIILMHFSLRSLKTR